MNATIDQSVLLGEIQKFIFDYTYGDSKRISPETLIFKEGYFDSMGFVSLISFLEEKFSIETSSEDLVEENFESMNAILKYIERKRPS